MSDEGIPQRPTRPRRHAVAVAVAVGLLIGALGGVGAHLLDSDDAESDSRAKPSAAPTAATTAGPRAEPIRSAMLAKQRVSVAVVARQGGDPDSFTGQARLDLVDATTARAATHVLYDMGEGHGWYPPEIVLIGNRAVITPAKEMTGPDLGPQGAYRTEADASAAAADDVALRNALETRWLAQPAHLVALLDNATELTTERANGTRTLTGSTPLNALDADPTIGGLYRPYATARPEGAVRFTLVVTAHDLPKSLKTEVPSRSGDDVFRVRYGPWGRGEAIEARPGPTPAPQWTTLS
ncbi:hypothetical protein ACFWPU_10590 [Streptomyces sp. NPDC058471]|uniref:hypothetical protein n=1 Tax=Streptomyces sp. NPDC058471 TaxID=3346516 RepID=UPI00364635EF